MLDKMNQQILNKMNGQDLSEFLTQRKYNRYYTLIGQDRDQYHIYLVR